MNYTYFESPVGGLLLAGNGTGLRRIGFPKDKRPMKPEHDWVEDARPFADVTRQLGEYFAGKRHDFRLELAPEGSAFQLGVWRELEKIPYGKTISYGELAERIGRPSASRAVGAANGSNPLPIVIPCHRVIGSDGTLTGYGGGLRIKEELLALEGARLAL